MDFIRNTGHMPMKNKKTLGIVGGMGAYAGEFFFRLVTERTFAKIESDHLDIIVSSLSSTPDRTCHILDQSNETPISYIQKSIDNLEKCGADIVAIPCNTATAYVKNIKISSNVIMLNIIYQAVDIAKRRGARSVGILATDGTIKSNLYQNECNENGIIPVMPNENEQTIVMRCIYDKLKNGITTVNEIYPILDALLLVSDCVILGCTELSMIDISLYKNRDYIIDSSRALAKSAILSCGAIPCGFEPIYN